MYMMRFTFKILIFIALLFAFISCKSPEQQVLTDKKHTILILGGTPSTVAI